MPNKKDEMKSAAMGTAKKGAQAMKGHTKIFTQLSEEHGQVAALMDEVAKTSGHGSAERRRDLFSKISKELVAHNNAEERSFYAALARHPDIAGRIPNREQEHHEANDLIRELAGMDPGSDAWMNRFLELKSAVEEHVRTEEKEIFPEADKLLSGQQQEEILREFQALRKSETKARSPQTDTHQHMPR